MVQQYRIQLQCRRPRFSPWVRKILGGGHGHPLLPGESQGQRKLAGYSPYCPKELKIGMIGQIGQFDICIIGQFVFDSLMTIGQLKIGQNDLGCTHSHTYFPDAFSSSAFFGLHSCSSQWMFYGAWLILSTMWHFCLCFILPAKLQPLGSCHCVPGTERVWIKQISLQDWCSSKIHILQPQTVPQPLRIVSLVLGSWLLFSIAIAPSLHLPTVCQQMTLLS